MVAQAEYSLSCVIYLLQRLVLELASNIQTRFQKISGFFSCSRFAKLLPCPLEASTFVNNLLKFRSNHIFLDILIIPLSDPVFLSYSCGV